MPACGLWLRRTQLAALVPCAVLAGLIPQYITHHITWRCYVLHVLCAILANGTGTSRAAAGLALNSAPLNPLQSLPLVLRN
jgi:hypothetical protein